jgi:hypothetical protein
VVGCFFSGLSLAIGHHDGNLAELSHHFGIDPAGDIVGPRDFGTSEPYDEPLMFSPADADPHLLTDGLTTIRLANVQTLQVLPGGTEWLRVGTMSSISTATGQCSVPSGNHDGPWWDRV